MQSLIIAISKFPRAVASIAYKLAQMRQLPPDAATFRSHRVRIDPHLIGIGVDSHKKKEEAQNELPLD